MVALINGRSPKTLQTLQTCEAFIEQLIQEIKKKEQQKKTIEKAKKYTAEIKKNIAKLEVEISDNQNKILEVKQMLSFPPGAWVQNGTKTPGQVINLVIAGRIPEVHVLWWGSTVQVPERPWKLKLLEKSDLEFIWNGDRFPKLIRRFDQIECSQASILQDNLDRLNICKKIAIQRNEEQEIVNEFQRQITYCKKRLLWLDSNDLVTLERTVKQGLEIFYRVGEALLEICDRKLYKQIGYSNFEEYCKDRWDMSKRHAYRLIKSAEVIKNITSQSEIETVTHGSQNLDSQTVTNWSQNSEIESVTNWSQNLDSQSVPPVGQNLPSSESVARELSKAPSDKQKKAWERAVSISNGRPTAAQTKAAVIEVTSNKKLVSNFKTGQLIKLQLSSFDGASEALKDANHSYGRIVSITESGCSLNVDILGHQSFIVFPQDLKPINSLPFSVNFSDKEFLDLMSEYKTIEEIENAIRKGVLGN